MLLAAGLLSAAIATDHAGAAELVPRFFAEAISLDDRCVDWEAQGSKGIVSYGQVGRLIDFITPGGPWLDDDAIVRDADGNVLVDLRSTRWVQMSVVHVTESGVEQSRDVYWLVEDLDGDGIADLPTAGMVSPTGPDGDAMTIVEIRIAQASTSDSFNPGRYYISPNGPFKFCIAVGRFQK
jgi:hypothetical protein